MFEITKKSSIFESLSFIVKAVSKDNYSHFALDKISVSKELIVSSDGHRLHTMENSTDIESGFYRVIKANKSIIMLDKVEEDFPFPKYEVITGAAIDKHKTVNMRPLDKFSTMTNLALIIRAMKDTLTVNHVYIEEATISTTTHALVSSNDTPVVIKSGKCTAYIMPVRVETK